jgi:DNA-binding transcriptional regulator YdaS (Cro superfamily)
LKALPVIKKFGGQYKLAKKLGVAESTVYRWTQPRSNGGTGGYIPCPQIPKILKLAKKEGIEIDD